MDKNEILEKSKEENKNMDEYENKVLEHGAQISVLVGGIIALIIFVTSIFTDHGQDYGVFAILAAMCASTFIYKAIKLKRKHEIFVACTYTVLAIAFLVAKIYLLICD